MLSSVKSAVSIGSRGTKRLAVEAFRDEVSPSKKGFFESLSLPNPFKGVMSSSSLRITGNSASETAPSLGLEGRQLPSDHGTEQYQTLDDIAAATDAQQEELIVQEIELMGGIPKESAERAAFSSKLIDRVVGKRREEEEVATFKLSFPDFNMDIKQEDEDWIKQRKFFVEELKVPTKTIMNILDETFTSTQQLYLIPPCDDGGIILEIQREHTKKYKEALGSTGTFRGVPDNLATKLTMLFFGLPIEPMTENNIMMSGEEGDITCKADKELDPPTVQRIMYAEKPLEFLDTYSEGRSHGFPMLRRPKQRGLIPPVAITSPIENALFANAPTQNGNPAEKIVGEATANILEAKTSGSAAAPLQASLDAHHGRSNRDHGTSQLHDHQPFIDPAQPPLTMRGGGLSAEVETEDEFEPAAAQPTDESSDIVAQNTSEAEDEIQSIRGPPISQQLTRLNKERVIKIPAGKPKAQKWSDWMTEQHFLDGLQRRSWIKDQSVVEPGRLPAPPLYGASRELQLKVGSSMPTIYVQRLTPTDVKQLQDENQKLRNQVLDRMFACPICDENFEMYEKDKIRDHCRQHQEQLAEAGQCPSCGDPQWAFLTNDQKRSHFARHQHQHESATIKKFYDGQYCPVCDRDLSKMKPDLVIRHCLEHAPGQVQFCDRCGLNELDCTDEELNHHHVKCRLADDRNPGDPEPVFCLNCGLNISRATDKEKRAHNKECALGPKGRFCMKCGLDETSQNWGKAAIDKHDSHCTAPSGFNKKFCRKCRTEVASLNEAEVALHRNTCQLVEPGVSVERSRIIELKARQDAARVTEARLNAFKSLLDNIEENQNNREITLVSRENEVNKKLSQNNALTSDINNLKQAQTGGNQVGTHNNDDNDVCPISLCSVPLSKMSKEETAAHIRTHIENNRELHFICPLEIANGDRCNHDISLEDNGFDLTVHYKHKLSEDEQETVKDNVSKTLRASIQAAQRQASSDVAFIKERTHLLISPKKPSPSFSAGTAKTTSPEKDASSSELTHHPNTDTWDVIAMMGRTGTPKAPADAPTYSQDAPAKRTSVGTDDVEPTEPVALPELAASLPPKSKDEVVSTITAARKAREVLATARRRRISVSEQVYKYHEEDDSTTDESDITEPQSKKKAPPAKETPVTVASVEPATVTNKKRKEPPVETGSASPSKKRVTALPSKIAKKVLAGMESGAEDVHPTKEKGRTVASSPVKTAPTAKKRKQVGDEDELTVTKDSLRNAPSSAPPKKKPKKAEERKEVKEPKEPKEAKMMKEVKGLREPKEQKEVKEAKEVKEGKKVKEVKKAKDPKNAATVGELKSKSTKPRRKKKTIRLSGGRGPAKV